MKRALTKILFISGFVIAVLTAAAFLPGCADKNLSEQKRQADLEVYKIIDEKWQDDFGSHNNYRISDVNATPGDIVNNGIASGELLSLPQAVALATANNREYQTNKEALYLVALELTSVRDKFESEFIGFGSAGYARNGKKSTLGMAAGAGMEQLLANGATISTNVTAAWVEVLTGNLRGGLISILNAVVTQPLLRGTDSRVVLEPLTQAEQNALYQLRLFSRFRKTFVVAVVTEYYNLLKLNDQVKNAQDNYDTLVKVHELAQKLADAGRLPRFELKEAQQDMLKANDMLVQAQKASKQALDQFKLTLGIPAVTELYIDTDELDVLRHAGLTQPDFTELDGISTAMDLRMDLANRKDQIADAQRKILVAADALGADLKLTLRLDQASRSSAGISGAKNFIDTAQALLKLDLPLDRLEERNAYRRSLIALNQATRDYEQTIDEIAVEVRRAYRDLFEAAQRHRIQSESLDLAAKRFDNTFLLLQYGRTNTRDVLDAREDLYESQNAATAALIDHAVATLNFYRDAGVIQIIPDGTWALH